MSRQIKMRETESLVNQRTFSFKPIANRSLSMHRYDQPYIRNKTSLSSETSSSSEALPQDLIKTEVVKLNIKVLNPFEPVKQKKPKKRKQKDKLCGNVMVSHSKKPIFRQIVSKYKRNFYPTNASRGFLDTSNQRVREPLKSRLFRQSLQVEHFDCEIRRMSVLSQVISQNNRRQIRMMRRNSIKRNRSMA